MSKIDDTFYDRADAHIHLSNDQVSSTIGPGKVSASMLYSTSRFNAFVSALGFKSKEEMKKSKAKVMEYYLQEYRKMLEENMDDYIKNFDEYFPSKT